jgi:hypothetical protein
MINPMGSQKEISVLYFSKLAGGDMSRDPAAAGRRPEPPYGSCTDERTLDQMH